MTTTEEIDLTFRGGVWVRPMFELIEEDHLGIPSSDAARWPIPLKGHDLGDDA